MLVERGREGGREGAGSLFLSLAPWGRMGVGGVGVRVVGWWRGLGEGEGAETSVTSSVLPGGTRGEVVRRAGSS